jgi:hypothetical protein
MVILAVIPDQAMTSRRLWLIQGDEAWLLKRLIENVKPDVAVDARSGQVLENSIGLLPLAAPLSYASMRFLYNLGSLTETLQWRMSLHIPRTK